MARIIPKDDIAGVVKAILTAASITTVPINLNDVASSLGITLIRPSDDRFAEALHRASIAASSNTIGASLRDKSGSYILAKDSLSPARMRTTIAHELGHHIQCTYLGKQFSYHRAVNHGNSLCIDGMVEKNAFEIGEQLLLPDEMIVEYLKVLPSGMDTIERIRKEFNVSIDVAGIRLARAHTMPVAFMKLTYNRKNRLTDPLYAITGGEPNPVPYTIKYCALSSSFPERITPGQLVQTGSLIDDTWKRRRTLGKNNPAQWYIQRDIPICGAGDKDVRITMRADCIPWERYGFFAIIWKP